MVDSQMSKEVILGLTRAVGYPLQSHKTDGTPSGVRCTAGHGMMAMSVGVEVSKLGSASDVPLNASHAWPLSKMRTLVDRCR